MNKNKLLIDLSESEKTKFGIEDFVQQSLPQKVFSAIWCVDSELNNGGFSQYFVSDSGGSTRFVVEALEAIGAPKKARICSRAIAAAFPAGLPTSPETIRSAAADFSDEILDKLDALDQEFFAYPHDLTDLLFAFVSENPKEFGILPKPDDGSSARLNRPRSLLLGNVSQPSDKEIIN